jgi:hypothetical protein
MVFKVTLAESRLNDRRRNANLFCHSGRKWTFSTYTIDPIISTCIRAGSERAKLLFFSSIIVFGFLNGTLS